MATKLNIDLKPTESLLDNLFTTQEQRDDEKREKVMQIPLSEIDPFPYHPFQVKHDEAMQNMAESIKKFGIQTPTIVRPKEDGRYELISGHRRKMACEIVGFSEMPCIVRQLSDIEAIVSMVDANLQRETILPSEKAKSYKMRLDAMKKPAGRPTKENVSPLGTNYRSDEELAKMSGESRNQIHRYIRLNELIPQILDMVDNAVIRDKSNLQIAMRPAVELSYLSHEQQNVLLEEMVANDCTPSHDQAIQMRKSAEKGMLAEKEIHSIMQETKPNQIEHFKIRSERLSKYFAPNTPSQKIEDTIFRALELLRDRERTRSGEAR
jgi:ParB family chromosome partitioning protein